MNPIYDGNCGIEEVPGSKITYRRGEAAQLIRVMEGQSDSADVTAFIAQYPILSTDYEFPSMVLEDIDVEYAGPTITARLTYFGIPGGPATVPNDFQTTRKWEPRSTILSTDATADGDWLVNYYAPIVTFRYCRDVALDAPLYQQYAESTPQITILDFTPAPGNLNANGYSITGNFVYDVYAVCTGFTREQKGNIFNYLETQAVVLQKKGSNAPRGLIINSSPNIPSTQEPGI